jgi:transcriptional regulator with XRE-family HTH domain
MYNTGGVLVKKREEIGAVLREEREKRGHTIRKMAEILDISPATISNMERGLANVSDEKYILYAKSFGLEKNSLI